MNVYDFADALLERLIDKPITFDRLETNEESFGYIRELLDGSNLFPRYEDFNLLRVEKSNDLALACRLKGNELFRQKKYFSALCAYNESLCFSEHNTEAMGLAFANRSAVYKEIDEYDRSKENIRLAKEFGYPERNFTKLDKREKECNGMSEMKPEEPKLLDLSHAPNIKYPFIAKCLTLKSNPQFGRHIVTNENLSIGDIVAIEKPFSSLLLPSFAQKRCLNCLAQCKLNLIPCRGCTSGKIVKSILFVESCGENF